jgi:hypothetical protein
MGMLVYAMRLASLSKQPNLKLKTRPKQLSGSLPLAFVFLRIIRFGSTDNKKLLFLKHFYKA